MRFSEAFGWGAICGLACTIVGLLGFAIGGHLYPQRYSQIPLDILLVPFGFIVGLVLAATVKLAHPRATTAQMFLTTAVAAIIYGGLMISYKKANAREASLNVTILPNPIDATACSSTSCEASTPEWQWTLQGTLIIQEKAGMGGRVDFVDVTSGERGPAKKGVAGAAVRSPAAHGPTVRYGARQIAQTSGTNRVGPGAVLTVPLRYSYRTQDGDSRRIVGIYVWFTDDAGHQTTSLADLLVR